MPNQPNASNRTASKSKRARHDEAFKAQVLEAVKTMTVKEASEKFNVSAATINNWKNGPGSKRTRNTGQSLEERVRIIREMIKGVMAEFEQQRLLQDSLTQDLQQLAQLPLRKS